jgi:hypothetical protein
VLGERPSSRQKRAKMGSEKKGILGEGVMGAGLPLKEINITKDKSFKRKMKFST